MPRPIRRRLQVAMEVLMDDKISVIVPTYNNAPWLSRCLESIRNQTYRNLEILVVDDGSQDETWKILQEFSKSDSRIIPIHQENGGVTSARLRGVALATGDWIGFIDGDDWIEPQMYEKLLHNAKTYKADISHCGHRMDYPDGTSRFYYNTEILRPQDRILGLRDLLEERLVEPGLCNKLYRESLFQGLHEIMPMQIRNNEDFLMNYFLFNRANQSIFEDICPYHYCIRGGSASQGKLNEHRIYDPIRVRKMILEQCDESLRPDAQRALVQTALFAYAQLCRGMEKEYAQDRKKVRDILRQQLSYRAMLPMKNAVMVWVVAYMPWVFHLVYGVYYFLKNRPGKG